MEESCKDIEQMLVDYVDGQLSSTDLSYVSEHLGKCEHCRRMLDGLRKSLELAGIIWADSLSETKNIRTPSEKAGKIRWSRYVAIAAGILLTTTTSVVWHTFTKPKVSELKFTEIERKITESGSAARLLAAAELLSEHPEAESIVKQQYRHIIEMYPETPAAVTAKLRIK